MDTRGGNIMMKAVNLAKIFILLAVICQLIVMSGWFIGTIVNVLQSVSLGSLLLTLFLLRKKKRKAKRKPSQPKEVADLVERAKSE